MEPNYKGAAAAASDTCSSHSSSDPLLILKKLRNVLLISYSFTPGCSVSPEQDAVTLVDKVNGRFRYIVMYDQNLPPVRLRFALARELAHVVLQHDGTGPEDVWMEEANCFAYHLLSGCTAFRVITIYYRPERSTPSASFKDLRTFDSIDALKRAVAEEHTRISRFIGRQDVYGPADIEIRNLNQKDIFGGWKNYSSVFVAGRPVGYCGE